MSVDPAGVEPASVSDSEDDLYTLVPLFVRHWDPNGQGSQGLSDLFSRRRVDQSTQQPAGFGDGPLGATRSPPRSVVALLIRQPWS